MVSLKCFHGTSLENGESILTEQHFRPSNHDKLRMGVGAYFFCQAGDNDTYPITCARELARYHLSAGKYPNGYMILSCIVECDEDKYLDLYNPNALEYFHQMRYLLLKRSLQVDPSFKYMNCAVADTQVFDAIRNIRQLGVIRCPQYFGMFEREKEMSFENKPQFPKTYVPNVIMLCVDEKNATIKEIREVERGT